LRENKAHRLSNRFFSRTKALQPHASFAEILSRGSLYETQTALSQIDSHQYAKLPAGQKVLMIAKMKDLIEIDQLNRRSAIALLL
jgi:hypothetical protein